MPLMSVAEDPGIARGLKIRALCFELESLDEKLKALRVFLKLGTHWLKTAPNLCRALLLELFRVLREPPALAVRLPGEMAALAFPLPRQRQHKREERPEEAGDQSRPGGSALDPWSFSPTRWAL
jgi:hypothetical protein